MVKLGENSAKFSQIWENLRNFAKKQQKIQRFLTKILRLGSGSFPPHGFPRFLGFDSKAVQRSALCRSRRELSNEYLLAKFGFDTAENEPCKVCPIERCSHPRVQRTCGPGCCPSVPFASRLSRRAPRPSRRRGPRNRPGVLWMGTWGSK